jgi:hypothetical protein
MSLNLLMLLILVKLTFKLYNLFPVGPQTFNLCSLCRILNLFSNVSSIELQIIHLTVVLNNYACLINLNYFFLFYFIYFEKNEKFRGKPKLNYENLHKVFSWS